MNLWSTFIYVPQRITAARDVAGSPYPFLDPAQGLFQKKDLIVNVQPLRDELEAIGKNKPITIYFEYLNTGANISVNKDLAIWPASLMKIPVAMAVMKKVERGEWKLTNELVLLEEDKDNKYGDLFKNAVGTRFTIQKLLEDMLINSDNSAKNIFLRNVRATETDEVLDHLGIEDIIGADYKVRSKKYSVFWRSLYTASYLTPEHSQFLIEMMSRSPHRQYLEQGTPNDVRFSHKIGIADNVHADSGILYLSRRPYILTVMLEENNTQRAAETMKDISSKVYSYVTSH